QVQPAAGGGGPAAGQVRKVAGLRGIHIGNRLGDRARDGVVFGVGQVAIGVFGPDGAFGCVEKRCRGIGRAGAVLRRAYRRRGNRLGLHLCGAAEPGVGIRGGFASSAIGIPILSVIGDRIDTDAVGGVLEVLRGIDRDGRAGLAMLVFLVLLVAGDAARSRFAGRGGCVVVGLGTGVGGVGG